MNNLLQRLVFYRALIVDVAETVLVLFVAFGLDLTADNQTTMVAVVIGVIGVAKGLLTSPFPVTVLTDLTRAVVVLFAGFGLELPADRIALAATAIGTLISLIQTQMISPNTARPVAAAEVPDEPYGGTREP